MRVADCLQILICQNLRNNLQHPNEYIRGVTLRFLCRIREEEILEPLIPSILACLEHRHSYVRRNAVLAINALYRLPRGELLLVDAPELIEKVTNIHWPIRGSVRMVLLEGTIVYSLPASPGEM